MYDRAEEAKRRGEVVPSSTDAGLRRSLLLSKNQAKFGLENLSITITF